MRIIRLNDQIRVIYCCSILPALNLTISTHSMYHHWYIALYYLWCHIVLRTCTNMHCHTITQHIQTTLLYRITSGNKSINGESATVRNTQSLHGPLYQPPSKQTATWVRLHHQKWSRSSENAWWSQSSSSGRESCWPLFNTVESFVGTLERSYSRQWERGVCKPQRCHTPWTHQISPGRTKKRMI